MQIQTNGISIGNAIGRSEKRTIEAGMLSTAVTAVWIHFPVIYRPVPMEPTAETVCKYTHKPPHERKTENRKKRNDIGTTPVRIRQPFDNSIMPDAITLTKGGTRYKNHF